MADPDESAADGVGNPLYATAKSTRAEGISLVCIFLCWPKVRVSESGIVRLQAVIFARVRPPIAALSPANYE